MNRAGLYFAVLTAIMAMRLGVLAAPEPTPEQLEFFENRIRPVLVERCHSCHSTRAEKVKGALLLDSQASMLKGGEDGAVVIPGQPEKSRLIQALKYADPDLQMPPKGKLPDAQVTDFVTWVKMGVPWPKDLTNTASAPKVSNFNLAKRRHEHWAWQPIHAPQPPQVRNVAWPRNPVDEFILARLESKQLQPATPAERQTLMRRIYFDLVGLPPTAEEQAEFLRDSSTDAYEGLVDRLLQSPHFGERWGRHWLDLVRYAETLGHEFDYPNLNAWRYRDYVIRAFNADVPYSQFVLEHVAGDLLSSPRRNPVDQSNEAVIGTAFYWLGQRDHSPVDVRQHQAELIDNQIDVLSKTFLGLTVACARCHDHKFDAISTADYYALYGILSSSRYDERAINAPETVTSQVERLQQLKSELRPVLAKAWLSEAEDAARYVRAATHLFSRQLGALDEVASEFNVDRERLDRWAAALQEATRAGQGSPLAEALDDNQSNARQTEVHEPGMLADFTRPAADLSAWFVEGDAFGSRPARTGDFMVGGPTKPVARILEQPAMHSGILSRRLQGVLRSPTFTITNSYIHVLAAGRDARINVPVDGFTMIRDPIYGGLKRVLNHDDYRWVTIDVQMWKDHRAYLEFSDISAPDPADDGHHNGFGTVGYIAVQRIVLSNDPNPPEAAALGFSKLLPETVRDETFAQRCQAAIQTAAQSWAASQVTSPQAALLNWLLAHELLDCSAAPQALPIVQEYARVEAAIRDPIRVPSLADGTGVDEPVFIRGNHKLPGPVVPRRFLEAIAGPNQPPIRQGSGRLELAEDLVAPSNPLLARVMVNRVWLHLFGRGIVPTPDDFGALGQPPSDPALLDWLADWYRTAGGWSTKKLIRLLVASSTYRMSSRPSDPVAEEKDPANLLWHRMPIRRLEGEAIRDEMLAVSGSLDPALAGPPVATHLTEFMDGRGRPGTNGPLDGAGRRSIYLEVRRNFLSPLMRTFDMPVPFTTVGRRTVSNVPAQSLILMNDPFVVEQAQRWAKHLLTDGALTPAGRVQRLYRAAFCRPASSLEVAEALEFIAQQSVTAGIAGSGSDDNPQVWADLCHVLFNVKEFVFLN